MICCCERLSRASREANFMEIFGLSEGAVRLGVFASVFVIMASAETILPRKVRLQSRSRRWFTNWSLVIVDSLVLRVIFPILAVGTAAYAQEQGWGLLSFVALPFWFAFRNRLPARSG